MKTSVPHWSKCDVSYAEAMAIKSVAAGKANEDQQRIFMAWLVSKASNVMSLAWDASSERASSFEAGRRYVGLKIDEVVRTNAEFYKLKEKGTI